MAMISWNVRLETRHPQIDEQHKALIQAFNDLHQAMKQGKGKDEVGRTLTFLTDYTKTHFRMEEDLMARSGYPGSPRHREAHGEFAAKAQDLADQHRQGRAVITLPVMTFIENWLMDHIQGEDVRLAQFLNGNA